MAIHDVWLHNLRSLVDAEGDGDKRKGLRSVADLSGLSEEYIYQLIEGKPKKDGAPRQVGKVAAKKIASAFANGRPESWFDAMCATPNSLSSGANPPPQINERRASYRAVSLEAAVEGLARHFESVDGYDKATAISLLTTLANSPDMHAVVAAGLKTLKPQVRGSPSKQGSPAQTPHDARAA